MTVGVLLLAAGQSRRFGSDKRAAKLPDGRTLLQTSIASIQAAGLPLLVCLPAAGTAAAQPDIDADTYYCANAEKGIGATIADAITQLAGWDATLIALADMPFIRPETFTTVAAASASDRIVAPYYNRRGHPVSFGSDFYADLAQLKGDSGARAIISCHEKKLLCVAVEDPGIHQDIDRPEDLKPLLQ